MAKMEIKIGKGEGTMTATAAKAAMRVRVYEICAEALRAEFGEDAVEWLRIPVSPTRDENLLGVKPADIEEDGGVFDGMFTISLTAKEWADRVGTKQTKPAFDWDTAANKYKTWAEAEAEKAAAKAADKAKREAEDAAAKAKREAEKAAKMAEAEAAKPETETDEK